MAGGRKSLVFLLGLLLIAGPATLPFTNASALPLAPFVPVTPLPSNEEEEGSSAPEEVAAVLDHAQHARRPVERHKSSNRWHVVHPPRRHHVLALLSLPPSPFRTTVNLPLHC